VVRHRLVQRIVEAYDSHDQSQASELRSAAERKRA
jgi:phosphate starvation-inducible PhoH-like protein